MQSYFFHLAFELYPYDPKTPAIPIHEPVYLPNPKSNLFTDALPSHSSSPWRISSFQQTNSREPKPEAPRLKSPKPVEWGASESAAGQSVRRRNSGSESGHSILRSTRTATKPGAETAVGVKAAAAAAAEDWRCGNVTITSINMESTRTEKSMDASSKLKSGPAGLATRGRFVPSDPKNTEVGWGVVHLYRDKHETSRIGESSFKNAGHGEARDGAYNEKDCNTLCILAVPSYMTPSDFLGFVGEKTTEDVSHFRLVRTARANKYMVLMKFREAKRARQWRKEWNGKLFNSTEVSFGVSQIVLRMMLTSRQSENCHVVFVKSITFVTPSVDSDPTSFPDMTHDPFTPSSKLNYTAPIAGGAASTPTATSSSTSLTSKPLAPRTPSLVELPTCPVCLERMDETSGLLTILCQHVFHCTCLSKWSGSGCPVCRYTQNTKSLPGFSHELANHGDEIQSECKVCRSTSNLWVCLICGSIGCGRYDGAHAFAHWEQTGHSFAMDIATQHVWDYAGDAYVHRLIHSKADGKLVELPAAFHNTAGTGDATTDDLMSREKLDSMGLEYTHLLTSQLESQRVYYEELVQKAVDKASRASASADRSAQMLEQISAQLESVHTAHKYLANEVVPALERDLGRAERRAEKFEGLGRKFENEWRQEKSMNEGLMARANALEERVKTLTAEKSELEEGNRDLMFSISAMDKLKEHGQEFVDGKVEVGQPPPPSGGKGKKKKKGLR